VTAPTITTANTCPPVSPCPAWCTKEHKPQHGSHIARMHHHIGEDIKTPTGWAVVSIAQHETWHAPDTEWTRQAPTVALILPGANLLVIERTDHTAMRLIGLLAYDLCKAVEAAHDLVKTQPGQLPAAETSEPSAKVREALAIAKQVNA
jgi:hypothetical protein